MVDSKILLCRRWCSRLYIFEDRTPKFCTDLIQCVYTCPDAGIWNQTSRSWDNFCNFWTRAQIEKPPRWTLASGLNMNYTKFHWERWRDELRKSSLLPHAFLLSRETSTCVYKRAHKAGFGANKRQRSGPRFANSGTGGTREKMRTVLKTRDRAEKDTIGIEALSRVIRKSVYSPLYPEKTCSIWVAMSAINLHLIFQGWGWDWFTRDCEWSSLPMYQMSHALFIV